MAVRQEKVVFLGAVAILGLLAWSAFDAPVARRISRGQDADELVSLRPPKVELALPERASFDGLTRVVFAPPSNTRPLAPLALLPPPRAPLPTLRPPTAPGPAPEHFQELLAAAPKRYDVPTLFLLADEGEGDREYATAEDLEPEKDEDRSLTGALQALGYVKVKDEPPPLSSEELSAQIEAWKSLYDWIMPLRSPIRYGRIQVAPGAGDRFRLVEAGPDATLWFDDVDPQTGEDKTPGTPAIPYQLATLEDFGFAQTPVNRIELRAREIGGRVTASTKRDVMNFADWCVSQRLEAPRALDVAEQHYRLVAELDPADPLPRLGLARCYEAGFDFERAFAEYQALRSKYDHWPEVHARLGELEARFLLFDAAEERFRRALTVGRTSWEAHWAYGRFLLDRGRDVEALEHLRDASNYAPTDADRAAVRVAIRTDLGAAYLRNGMVADAQRAFQQALNADADDDRALAGLISCAALDQVQEAPLPLPAWLTQPTQAVAAFDGDGLGFDLLLAGGLYATTPEALAAASQALGATFAEPEPARSSASGSTAAPDAVDPAFAGFANARDRLLDAAKADPLRAPLAWRALSWLAETTANPEEAWRYVELAYEAAPNDPWTLYQRGRLLAARDDDEGAAAAFQEALEIELDFEDALVERAELAFRASEHEAAERYLERAVSLDPSRAEVHVLRGLNLLQLDRIEDAADAFEAAKALEPQNPTALNGLAWCEYRRGNAGEAIIQLGHVDEMRTPLGEDDPHAVWARGQIERITDHREKELWTDSFDRSASTRLLNDWNKDESRGPTARIADGAVVVEGVFTSSGSARVWQNIQASLWVAIEADVWVSGDTVANAGLFVARERLVGSTEETVAGVAVLRHKDGALQYVITRPGNPAQVVDVAWVDDFRVDRWVRLRMERFGEPSEATLTISVDGTPIAQNVKMPDLGRAQTDVKVGLFVDGDTARKCLVKMDDVQIVRRK